MRDASMTDGRSAQSVAASHASCSRWASSLLRDGCPNNHLNSVQQPCSAESSQERMPDNLGAAQAPACFLLLQETLTLLGRSPGKEAAIRVIPYAVSLTIAWGCLPSRPLDPFCPSAAVGLPGRASTCCKQ